MKNKYAFTLAEVLVTLVIIGVIAVLTLPALIQKYQKTALKSQLQKTYSELLEINQRFVLDFGMNMCQFEWNNIPNTGTDYSGKALPEQFSTYLKKGKKINSIKYSYIKNLTGKSPSYTQMFDDGSYTDIAGRMYFFEYSRQTTNKCPIITVDLNGLNKPNRMGYDIFMFRPTYDGRVIGMGKDNREFDATVDYGGIDKIDNPETYCNFEKTIPQAEWDVLIMLLLISIRLIVQKHIGKIS